MIEHKNSNLQMAYIKKEYEEFARAASANRVKEIDYTFVSDEEKKESNDADR